MRHLISILTLTICLAISQMVSAAGGCSLAPMQSLIERVERDASTYTTDQLREVTIEFQQLNAELQHCTLSPDQQKQLASLQGRFAAASMRVGINNMGSIVGGLVDQTTSFFTGFFGGLAEHKDEISESLSGVLSQFADSASALDQMADSVASTLEQLNVDSVLTAR